MIEVAGAFQGISGVFSACPRGVQGVTMIFQEGTCQRTWKAQEHFRRSQRIPRGLKSILRGLRWFQRLSWNIISAGYHGLSRVLQRVSGVFQPESLRRLQGVSGGLRGVSDSFRGFSGASTF